MRLASWQVLDFYWYRHTYNYMLASVDSYEDFGL